MDVKSCEAGLIKKKAVKQDLIRKTFLISAPNKEDRKISGIGKNPDKWLINPSKPLNPKKC